MPSDAATYLGLPDSHEAGSVPSAVKGSHFRPQKRPTTRQIAGGFVATPRSGCSLPDRRANRQEWAVWLKRTFRRWCLTMPTRRAADHNPRTVPRRDDSTPVRETRQQEFPLGSGHNGPFRRARRRPPARLGDTAYTTFAGTLSVEPGHLRLYQSEGTLGICSDSAGFAANTSFFNRRIGRMGMMRGCRRRGCQLMLAGQGVR